MANYGRNVVKGKIAYPQGNALSRVMMGQVPPSADDSIQPMNTIRTSSGEYLSPMGRQDIPYQFQSAPEMQPRQQRSGGVSLQDLQMMLNAAKSAPSGDLIAKMYQQANPESPPINAAAIDATQKAQIGALTGMEAGAKASQKASENAIKANEPKYDAQSGGFVYPPSPAHPQGIFVPVEGTATQQKTAAQKQQEFASFNDANSGLDRLAEAADMLKNHPGVGRITGIEGKFPNMSGSAAADAQAQLEALKSQTAFSVLQAMRNASKTGGALGQVSDAEEKLLANNLAALDTSQSPEQFKANLQKIVDFAKSAKERLNKAYSINPYNPPVQPMPEAQKTVVRTGNYNGRKVVQYSDGSMDYAD